MKCLYHPSFFLRAPKTFLWFCTQVELLEPPISANVGERVTFPGYEGVPDELLNPKKKVWETLQVDLRTNAELIACYKDVPFTTAAGVCKASSIGNGTIR